MNARGPVRLTRKDFTSSQDVRWCPGCGNNAILAQMQKTLPELGVPRENIVIISGIGCFFTSLHAYPHIEELILSQSWYAFPP